MPAFHTARAWMKLHPYQTSVHTLNGLVLIEPSIFYGPILFALGFYENGPGRGMLHLLLGWCLELTASRKARLKGREQDGFY
jgi:hypothetical protein